MDQAPQADNHDHEQGQRKVIQRLVTFQADAEQSKFEVRARDIQETILAAGEAVPFNRKKPEYLAKGNRQQRVVNTAPVGQERGHDGSTEGGEKDRAE